MPRVKLLSAIIAPLLLLAPAATASERPVLEISSDTVLDPDKPYGGIVVKASGITIDGRGAILLGAEEGDPKTFTGTAIRAEGMSGVTLRNVRARGFERGLHVSDAEGWTVEGCDFSDNFHDPRFGWGENGRRGGILLERVRHSALTGNRANRVWDGCVLVNSSDNELVGNDFSHASNTCLSLWTSCRNTIRGNTLSHGIRIDPGEVHARDSTGVLIESGSNDNRFTGNDCRHGGDGIFIRVLNGWVSTGNVFEGNDCSHANNNCIEAWAPRNRWIRNKANGGSYGFWLGASDQNELVENEACGNGRPDGPHNSPHLPDGGHAGIVFMFGPSSHTVLRGNVCRDNHGAGIAAIGDLDPAGVGWKAFHWIAEENLLEGNRWGIYLHHADMLDLAGNRFAGNAVADVHDAGDVRGLRIHAAAVGVASPEAVMAGPTSLRAGQPARFDASASRSPSGAALTYRWQIDDETFPDAASLETSFPEPGFHRVALTVTAAGRSALAWRDLYVVDDATEVGTEWPADAATAVGWSAEDPGSTVAFSIDRTERLVGAGALRAVVDPYSGGRVTLHHDLQGEPYRLRGGGRDRVVAWIAARNPNVPAWQDGNPVVTLADARGRTLELRPQRDLLAAPAATESREGWLRVEAPIDGGDGWTRSGEAIEEVTRIGLGFDSWGAPALEIRIDGLHLSGRGRPAGE
jgi:parallel beta-helix repeat protein